LIVSSEKRKDKKIEIRFSIEKCKSSALIILSIPNIDTAARVGIDRRKDNFAASYLLKFSNLAAVIVIPDLLTPGINAST
tara:strand:- start:114 stop:353 length:240 start_codon:yes stop_codon:yes gene_type:complete